VIRQVAGVIAGVVYEARLAAAHEPQVHGIDAGRCDNAAVVVKRAVVPKDRKLYRVCDAGSTENGRRILLLGPKAGLSRGPGLVEP
jgi:hypothetical protein